ncbi:MAG: MFS transporter, partial [Bacteroidota bacterium]|nr:MFS transporter [Bacteroidota bacterium]
MGKNKMTKELLKDKNLQIIFGITLIGVMGVTSITPAFPKIQSAFDLTNQQVGLLITFFSAPGIVISPISGILADRYGRKTILIPSLILFAIAGTACFFVTNFNTLLIARVLQGVGAAPLGALNLTLIGDLFTKEKRNKAMGITSSILSIGTAIYPLIGGALAIIGWNFPFLLPLTAIPIALFVIFRLNNPEPLKNNDFNNYFSEAFNSMKNREVSILFLSSFIVFIMLFGGIFTYLPLLLNKRLGSDSLEIGILLTSMSVVAAIISFNIEKLTRKFDQRSLITFSFFTYSVSLLLIPFMQSTIMILIPTTFFAIGNGIFFPNIYTRLSDLSKLKYRALFMSVNGAILRTGQTMGSLVAGAFFLF